MKSLKALYNCKSYYEEGEIKLMLEPSDRELISRIKLALSRMDEIITLYRSELKEGRFRPRNGEFWERTIEKQIIEVATTELQHLTEQESLGEICKLVDDMEEFAKKARLVDV